MNANKNSSPLPSIAILVFDGFLTNEVVAPLNVFTKPGFETRQSLFNVFLVAKEEKIYISEEGLRVLPDYSFDNCPPINILVVPGSMNPEHQTTDWALVDFVKKISDSAEYTSSHCSGAFILGEAEIAKGKKLVTHLGGSSALQQTYPELQVQDDGVIKTMRDGNIFSSNGGLVSYISSLDLLETLTSKAQRHYVEEQLLLNRIR